MTDNILEPVKALSIEERMSRVHAAWYAMNHEGEENYEAPDCWITDIYEDYVIVRENALFYRVLYTIDEASVTFAGRDMWQLVEKEWQDVMMPNEPEITYGGEVKALGNGLTELCVVRFSDPSDVDLVKEYFDATTDFDIEEGDKLSVYYQHGMDATLKNKRFGREPVYFKDGGIFLQHQLDLRDEYEAAIYRMVEMGKMGGSSGPAQHLVRKEKKGDAVHITHWPLKEISYTPTPMDPHNSVMPLKALPETNLKQLLDIPDVQDGTVSPEANLPEAANAAADAVSEVKHTLVVIHSETENKEGDTMAEQVTPVQDDEKYLALENNVKSLSDQIAQLIQNMQDVPAVKNSGYFTQDGGKADARIKSFGDFLIAVTRGDETRLKSVYGSVKTLSEDSGVAGGYAVPTDYSTQLLNAIRQASAVMSLVNPTPVSTRSGEWPVLDYTTAPTAGVGDTAMGANATFSKRAELGTFANTEPKFAMLKWQVNSIGAVVPVSNELIADSAVSIDALLTNLAATLFAAKREYGVLNGNGVGEPLGILNASDSVSVSAASGNTFAYVDASNMIAKFKGMGGRAAWVMHPSTVPDIARFEVGTGGAVWVNNMSQGFLNMPLLGYPVILSEHLPQADSSGHVVLADFGQYLFLERGGFTVGFSPHRYFEDGKSAWRFESRYDGRPGFKGPITLGGPGSAYTMSPFVYFAD